MMTAIKQNNVRCGPTTHQHWGLQELEVRIVQKRAENGIMAMCQVPDVVSYQWNRWTEWQIGNPVELLQNRALIQQH